MRLFKNYPATCVLGEERFVQPIISSDESQWMQSISRDDVNAPDNGKVRQRYKN